MEKTCTSETLRLTGKTRAHRWCHNPEASANGKVFKGFPRSFPTGRVALRNARKRSREIVAQVRGIDEQSV